MNNQSHRDNAANAWLVRLNSANVSEQDIAAFQKWLAEDVGNQSAYLKAEQYWQAAALLQKPNINPEKNTSHWHFAWAGAVAAVLLLVVVTLLVVQEEEPANQTQWLVQTQVGEQKAIELPDGTKIFLNTNSQIQVDLLPLKRLITMIKGEVFFGVAKNSDLPFEVHTPSGIVQVLGTQFAVNLAGSEPSVTVLEGRVALMDSARPQSQSENTVLELVANQKAVLGAAQKKAQQVDAAALTSWRNKVLTYSNASVVEILEDLNRYFSADIELQIPDDQLEQWHKTSAVIQLKDEKTTVSAVASALGLTLEVDEDGNRYVLQP